MPNTGALSQHLLALDFCVRLGSCTSHAALCGGFVLMVCTERVAVPTEIASWPSRQPVMLQGKDG